MSAEIRAAIIGAVVGALISGVITVWSTNKMELVENKSREFQERLEQNSLSRTLGASRGALLAEVAIDILKNYGDVTAVKEMPDVEWYRLNSYQNMLKVLGADVANDKLKYFYRNTNRNALSLNETGRDAYYRNLDNLTIALRNAIDDAYR